MGRPDNRANGFCDLVESFDDLAKPIRIVGVFRAMHGCQAKLTSAPALLQRAAPPFGRGGEYLRGIIHHVARQDSPLTQSLIPQVRNGQFRRTEEQVAQVVGYYPIDLPGAWFAGSFLSPTRHGLSTGLILQPRWRRQASNSCLRRAAPSPVFQLPAPASAASAFRPSVRRAVRSRHPSRDRDPQA